MKNIIVLFIGLVLFAAQATAQDYKTQTEDGINASTTVTKVFNLGSDHEINAQVLTVIDSVSGTPSGTVTLKAGLTPNNFTETIGTVTFTTGVDTAFSVLDATFNGRWLQLQLVTTSTTQELDLKAVVQSQIK